jgi:Protein of unknown function (DUF3634)
MGLIQPVVVVFVLAAGAWFVLAPQFAFRVRISHGSLRLTRGKLTHSFLEELTPICREWDIKRGWIGGVRSGKRLTLVFSRSVPRGCRQQIRNLLTNF